MIRVFVSSVSKGLVPTRQQIIADLRTAGYDVGAMESFGAQADPPLDACLRDLRKSDVVVLVVGPRYGSLLPQGISYTQAEFREARALGLPILAFRVPDAADLVDDEKSRLSAFLTEVGSATTYDSLSPGESLDRLSGKVLAALTAARDRGVLGSRYSLFQPFDRCFAKQLGTSPSLFNHEGPFLGRDAELDRAKAFLRGTEPVLLLKAPGGSGKSRLLLELAKYAASTVGAPTVLFVDAGGQWTSDDINRLPGTPTVLVFDDAHRRADLDRLISACIQHNPQARVIVSCRPSAVNIVTPHIASLSAGTAITELELPPLSSGDAESLARHHLGARLAELAPRLIRIADRNPLVIAVGGRCIADKRVLPEVLERTPELFRSLVLDRLLDDPGLGLADSEKRRGVLEVVAAVGPVITESDEFVAALSALVGAPQHEVRRMLAALERASFLSRRGRLVRVSPDVLSDHLLYRAAVDETGRPTGFVEAMVRAFSPAHLENILANAAELDWRASTAATHESVLATTWRDLLETLPQATNSQRATLAGQLKRSAAFAPDDVLRVAEWLADHPETAPPDESLRTWGLNDSFDRVADALTDVFAFIATHPDFTTRCVNRLWQLAAADARPTNPNPSHPRRRIEDLLKYEWRADWQSPDGVHVRVIDYVVQKVRESPRSDDRSWAIGLMGKALDRLGEANESNRRSFTIRQFSLAKFVPQLSARRDAIITCLRDVALGPRAGEAAAALHELSALFRAPRGPFGKELDSEELAAWRPEAERAIEIHSEAAASASSEAIRFLARRSLREASRDQWPDVVPILDRSLERAPAIASEGLYDLLVGLPWEEQLDDYEAEQRRVGELCDSASIVFWREHRTAGAVVGALLAGEAAVQSVAGRGESHAGRLVRSLVSAKPDQARAMIEALAASGEAGWRLFRPALLAMHDIEPVEAVRLVDRLTRDNSELLRAHAVDPLQWMADGEATSAMAMDIARRLSQDPSSMVKRVVAQVLRRFRERSPAEAISVLTSIDWAGDLSVATAVLDVLHPKYGLDPHKLSDEEIGGLLRKIESLQTLEGRAHDIFEFIAFASIRQPKCTIEMLLRRVLSVDDHQGERGEDRWTPIPYNARGLSLPGLSKAEDYPALLRLVRDAEVGASLMVGFWLPTLFHAATVDLGVALDVLREWVNSRDEKKIIAAAHLLRGFEHSIVFSVDEFIADLLDAAARSGQDCLDHTRSELFATAIGGVHSGTPGQPAPRYLNDKASAQELAMKYANRIPAKDFYDTLVRHAESSISRDMQQWDEEGDE